MLKKRGMELTADRQPHARGLFAHQDGDDDGAFCQCSAQERLHKHFAGCTGVPANGFGGFEADESEG